MSLAAADLGRPRAPLRQTRASMSSPPLAPGGAVGVLHRLVVIQFPRGHRQGPPAWHTRRHKTKKRRKCRALLLFETDSHTADDFYFFDFFFCRRNRVWRRVAILGLAAANCLHELSEPNSGRRMRCETSPVRPRRRRPTSSLLVPPITFLFSTPWLDHAPKPAVRKT